MPTAGDVLELTIEDITSDGDGVARVDGQVLFVPGGLPGDVASVRIEGTRKRVTTAVLLGLSTPAIARRDPPCRHQPICGGCALMPLGEETQLALKARHLKETIRRIGKLDPPEPERIAAPEPLRYRGRLRFTVAPRQHGATLGFHPRGAAFRLVPIDRCQLAADRASELAHLLLAALDRATPAHRSAWPDAIELRGSRASGQWLAVIAGTRGAWPECADAASSVLASCPDLAGVVRIETFEGRTVRETLLGGSDHVIEVIGEIPVALGASSFLQVNPPVAEQLYGLAARWVDSLASQPRTALDLFCGAGLAGLLATARTTALHGIDNHDEVIAAARRSAAAAGRSEARYDARDARAALRELAQQGAHYDFALINPPRAGLGADLAPVVAALGVRAVVMISCHPAALARDLSALDAAGLKLTRLAAVDMFPQTAELEALALAVRDAD